MDHDVENAMFVHRITAKWLASFYFEVNVSGTWKQPIMRCAITVILAMLSAFVLGDVLARDVFLHLTHTTSAISSPSLYPSFSMQFAGLMSLVAGASVLDIWPSFSGRRKVWSIVLTIGMLALVVSLSSTLNGAGINVLGFAIPFFMLMTIRLIRGCRKKVEKQPGT